MEKFGIATVSDMIAAIARCCVAGRTPYDPRSTRFAVSGCPRLSSAKTETRRENGFLATRNRGEPPLALSLIDWLSLMLQNKPGPAPPFRSAAASQFWCQRQEKSW